MPDSPSENVPRSVLLARQEWAESLGRLQQIHRLGLAARLPEAARLVHHLRALTGMLPEVGSSEAVVGWLHGTLETACSTCPPGTPLANHAHPLLASLNAACEVLFERAGLVERDPPESARQQAPLSEPYPAAPVPPAVTPRLPVLPPIRKLGRAAAPLVQKQTVAEERTSRTSRSCAIPTSMRSRHSTN